jgi:hypothetical protein
MQQAESEGSESPLNKVMDPTTVEPKWMSPTTEDGSMDRRGNPAVRAATGRWRSAILLLGKSYSVLYFLKKEKDMKHLTCFEISCVNCKHRQNIVGNACFADA